MRLALLDMAFAPQQGQRIAEGIDRITLQGRLGLFNEAVPKRQVVALVLRRRTVPDVLLCQRGLQPGFLNTAYQRRSAFLSQERLGRSIAGTCVLN